MDGRVVNKLFVVEGRSVDVAEEVVPIEEDHVVEVEEEGEERDYHHHHHHQEEEVVILISILIRIIILIISLVDYHDQLKLQQVNKRTLSSGNMNGINMVVAQV